MKWIIALAALLALSPVAAIEARAATLVAQLPKQQWAVDHALPPDVFLYDDFTLETTSRITQFTWWGWDAVAPFTVEFWIQGEDDWFYLEYMRTADVEISGGGWIPRRFDMAIDVILPSDRNILVGVYGAPDAYMLWQFADTSLPSNIAGSPGSLVWSEKYQSFGTAGGDFAFQLTGEAVASAVPETSTWALLLVGFGLAGGMIRRQTKRAAPLRLRGGSPRSTEQETLLPSRTNGPRLAIPMPR
ncbi:PEPxxWA-CTERM sorting domain-containing protein [Sphingomonas qilianensis]|uniref:PEPxxWA-CTERM sorting domain-containing protein n=1 Tax=Sphingomonas qilianensis TaxID=1736690 RepID=A0ABU9XSR8_9SPHN